MKSNLTMKDNLKIIGAEALYFLASAVVAGMAALVQMIGRTYEGDYSGFIFSGSNYRYNVFFYIIGFVLFIGFMIAGYVVFLRKKIRSLRQCGLALKIMFPVVALFMALAMLAMIVLGHFMITGLNDNMRPAVMFLITAYGWPAFSLVFMIVVEIQSCRRA